MRRVGEVMADELDQRRVVAQQDFDPENYVLSPAEDEMSKVESFLDFGLPAAMETRKPWQRIPPFDEDSRNVARFVRALNDSRDHVEFYRTHLIELIRSAKASAVSPDDRWLAAMLRDAIDTAERAAEPTIGDPFLHGPSPAVLDLLQVVRELVDVDDDAGDLVGIDLRLRDALVAAEEECGIERPDRPERASLEVLRPLTPVQPSSPDDDDCPF